MTVSIVNFRDHCATETDTIELSTARRGTRKRADGAGESFRLLTSAAPPPAAREWREGRDILAELSEVLLARPEPLRRSAFQWSA